MKWNSLIANLLELSWYGVEASLEGLKLTVQLPQGPDM